MQEAFLTLWERWDTIDRIDDPTGYLFRVALNGFRMRARAARRAARRLVADRPVVRPVRRGRPAGGRPQHAPLACPRANAPPSSCSTSTATARRMRPRSCGSVPPPCERSPPRAEPCCEPLEARMAELKEVFEMTTKQVEPDLDFVEGPGAQAGADAPASQDRRVRSRRRDRVWRRSCWSWRCGLGENTTTPADERRRR